ncbi:hypothetical protein ACLMJK_000949 [Lecanora helva]
MSNVILEKIKALETMDVPTDYKYILRELECLAGVWSKLRYNLEHRSIVSFSDIEIRFDRGDIFDGIIRKRTAALYMLKNESLPDTSFILEHLAKLAQGCMKPKLEPLLSRKLADLAVLIKEQTRQSDVTWEESAETSILTPDTNEEPSTLMENLFPGIQHQDTSRRMERIKINKKHLPQDDSEENIRARLIEDLAALETRLEFEKPDEFVNFAGENQNSAETNQRHEKEVNVTQSILDEICEESQAGMKEVRVVCAFVKAYKLAETNKPLCNALVSIYWKFEKTFSKSLTGIKQIEQAVVDLKAHEM